MPTKPQSPGPNPTTSLPKAARSRRAANLEQTIPGRAGSAGGILLDQEHKANMSSKPVTKAAATSPPTKDAAAATTAATGPNRQRRRPRKLNKEPTSTTTSAPTPSSITATTSTSTPKLTSAPTKADLAPQASTTELEALKSRIRSLEAKVEQLYTSNTRSPRRRGKARKTSSATTVPTLSRSNTAETATGTVEEIDDEEEADEELVRLEGELEIARQDLDAYRPRRPRTRRSESSAQYEDEDVEEVPRDDFTPGTQNTAGGKQVTLSGNYRIPLPANVSMTDVKHIQSGVSAAQNVAKSFLEQRRAQAKLNPQPPKATATPKAKGKAPASTAVSTETQGEGKSWGEWFGGYSVAITRAVKSIEAEAALETQRADGKRPTQAGRTASGKSAVVKPTTTKTNAGAVSKTGNRPPLKPRAGNLSSEQVQGLMK